MELRWAHELHRNVQHLRKLSLVLSLAMGPSPHIPAVMLAATYEAAFRESAKVAQWLEASSRGRVRRQLTRGFPGGAAQFRLDSGSSRGSFRRAVALELFRNSHLATNGPNASRRPGRPRILKIRLCTRALQGTQWLVKRQRGESKQRSVEDHVLLKIWLGPFAISLVLCATRGAEVQPFRSTPSVACSDPYGDLTPARSGLGPQNHLRRLDHPLLALLEKMPPSETPSPARRLASRRRSSVSTKNTRLSSSRPVMSMTSKA